MFMGTDSADRMNWTFNKGSNQYWNCKYFCIYFRYQRWCDKWIYL